MSEGDVSLIRDEDVLRRLWQQTEDFSRKKEIRAHMYRLREERLRNLYSPEPSGDANKGCEFTSPQGHVKSFADQTFQSMKSKEVRDAGSPPKEFTYHGQDLKDLSNAGWNVESEDRTTDDGHTHVKSVNANIEGRYDVEGGKGQFVAVDHHTQAVTEYQDENSSLKRNESSSKTAAREQVVRKTDDGSHFSSTTSSSSTSKYHQMSTRNETLPYTDDFGQRITDTNRNEQLTRDNYEQTLRSNDHGELMSREIEYPDDNTRVIVETRRLPDGTRVTSTRREFRVPEQRTRSEHYSQSETENKCHTSHKTNKAATSKTTRHTDDTFTDIVDSQRNVDNYDFKKHTIDDHFSETQSVRNFETNVTRKDLTNNDNYSITSRHESSKKIIDNTNIDDNYSVNKFEKITRNIIDSNQSDNINRHESNKQVIDQSQSDDDYSQTVRYMTKINKIIDDNDGDRRPNKRPDGFDNVDRREITISRDAENKHRKDIKDNKSIEEKIHTITKDTKEHIIDRKTTDQYQTTYQTDYAQKKICTDWSPSHQAWASTLRSDTPSTTRPSTRASSPGSRTFKSSTSSLRSSVSPDKTFRKPSSRGTSPSKIDRYSPSRTVTDKYSSTYSAHSITEVKSTKHTGSDGRPPKGRSPTRPGYSPDRKIQERQRPSVSPDKHPHDYTQRPSASPERKSDHKSNNNHSSSPSRSSEVPPGVRQSPDRKPAYDPTNEKLGDPIYPRSKSPQRFVSEKQLAGRPNDSTRTSTSPVRKSGSLTPIDRHSPVKEDIKTTSPSIPYYPNDIQKRPSVSPDRKQGYKPLENQPKKSTDKSPQKQSANPDKIPGYMKPTASSQPTQNLKSPTKPAASTDFKSPAEIPETCRPQDHTTTSKVKEDHHKFISEEITIYENNKKVDTKRISKPVREELELHEKSSSPTRNVVREVNSDHGNKSCDIDKFDVNVMAATRKKHDVIGVTTTSPLKPEDLKDTDRSRPIKDCSPDDISFYNRKYSKDEVKSGSPKDKDSPKSHPDREASPSKSLPSSNKPPQDEQKDDTPKYKDSPKHPSDRESSPFKYGTYNKKHPRDEMKGCTPKDKDSPISHPDKEVSPTKSLASDNKRAQVESNQSPKDNALPKYQPVRESSPTKYGTYDRKRPQEEFKSDTPKDKELPKFPTDRERSPVKKETHEIKYTQDKFEDCTPEHKVSPKKHDSPQRERSPTKYDKNLPFQSDHSSKDASKQNVDERTTIVERDTIITTKESKDAKYNSLTRQEKVTKKSLEQPASFTNKIPRNSVSPVKSFTKDNKCQHTTDFLATERLTEELNKNTTKDHPRQLVTPSSSPTRKPKPETEPSTGQSSPTTSVSGFVYFGSPPREKTEITNLDDQKYCTESITTEIRETHERSDILHVPRTPSPSKIPCRSPSPEKDVASNKDSLPRKSSLKKPSEPHQPSSTEKHPSHSRVIEKDGLEMRDEESKSKPLLERRETYEDRCKKILGVIDIKETVKKPRTHEHEAHTNLHSSCISHYENSIPNDSSSYKEPVIKKYTRDVTDFITHEKDTIVGTTHQSILYDEKPDDKDDEAPEFNMPNDIQPDFISGKRSKSDMPSRDSCSPDDMKHISKQLRTAKSDLNKPTDKKPSSSRPSLSPERKPGYMNTTTVTSKHITSSIEDITEATITTTENKLSPTKPVELSSRQSPKTKDDQLRCNSPTKHVKDDALTGDISPTKQTPSDHNPNKNHKNISEQTPLPNKSEIIPGYMKTTASITSKYDTYERNNIQEMNVSSKNEQLPRKSSKSPTRKRSDEEPRVTIPLKQNKYPDYQGPERKIKPEQPLSPTKDAALKEPEHKTPQTPSPNKSEGYTKAKTVSITKHDMSSTADVNEETTSKTGKDIYPKRLSESPTRIKPEENKPRDETPSRFKNIKDVKPKQTENEESSLPIDDFPTKLTTSKHFKESYPTSSSKTPGHMQTTTAISAKYDTVSSTEDFETKTILKTTDKSHNSTRISESPTFQVDYSEYTSYPNDNLSTRDGLSPELKPGSRNHQPSSPTLTKSTDVRNLDKTTNYIKTTTTCSNKYDTVENTNEISSRTVDKKYPKPSVSPSQHKDQTNSNPEYRRTTSPSRPGHPKHNTSPRDSLSPERKPEQRPINREDQTQASDELLDNSSPTKKIPSYMKTTISVTTKHDTNVCSKDIEESITSKSVHMKHSVNDKSPTHYINEHLKTTNEYPRTRSPSRSEDSSPKRSSSSPERKPVYRDSSPIEIVPTKKTGDKHREVSSITGLDKSPENIVTAATFTSIEGTEQEIIKSKITEKKPKLTESPTRQNVQLPEFYHQKTKSPSRPQTHEKSPGRDSISPERKPSYADAPSKKSHNSYTKDTSPTTKDTIRKVTNIVSKNDITSKTEETISSKAINKIRTTSQSPTHKPKEQPKSHSHHQRANSPYSSRQPEQKLPIRASESPERKPVNEQNYTNKAPIQESSKKKPVDKHSQNISPSRSDKVPGCMKTTTSVTSKYDASIETDNIVKTVTATHKTTEKTEGSHHSRTTSPTRPKYLDKNNPRDSQAPEREPVTVEPTDELPTKPDRTKDNIKSATYKKTKLIEEEKTVATKTVEKKYPSKLASSPTSKTLKDTYSKPTLGQTRTISPTKLNPKSSPPLNKLGHQQSSVTRDISINKSEHPKTSTPSKPEEKKPSYIQQSTSVTSHFDINSKEDVVECITSETVKQYPSSKSNTSPTKSVPEGATKPEHLNKTEEPRQLRTPSPIKKMTRLTEENTNFIISEREQEVLHRVQQSLRQLSPERKDRSPSPEKSLTKTTTSLHDLDIKKSVEIQELITNEITETNDEVVRIHTPHFKVKDEKPKEQKVANKPRTISPNKKPGIQSPKKVDKIPESPTKSRSISPKKQFGERPQSPQVPKIGTVKSKEQTPVYMTRKPTPATITTTKIEKAVTMDVKKAVVSNAKQNISKSIVKATVSKFMSPTTRAESEPKRAPTPKGIKEYPKKDTDIKVTRTTSDTTSKSKKTSPQRMKAKPEIQVNDLSTSKTPKSGKESQPKFPSKPKSATSLNTSTDEDDVIIDVQQSKSSRENSPDRICPTPVNFSDDVGTPRFPDQVSEPDDELRKRTHNTIHETESLVDGIVEICEDDELFVKRTNVKELSEYDESVLSVHDKVSKFTNKIEKVSELKDTTMTFKDTEIKAHSDFFEEKLESDECLLSVSEKVTKFAKGPCETRDSKSPSRRIVDEYDKHTAYQDDYTKLSVNDKAHLFVETAENIKMTKSKPAQRAERPDLTNVDESLKSDDCLLSVSDKVNKFVKTAEQFFIETHEVDEKDKKIKEQHAKIMRQIVGDYDDETTEYTEEVVTESTDRFDRHSPDHFEERPQPRTKETISTYLKDKEYNSPNLKSKDRAPPVKITTLRSSEAVKKAKALFENIASTTQKTKDIPKPTAKLTDIGVKKIPKMDTPIDSHFTVEKKSCSNVTDLDTEVDIVSEDHNESTSIEIIDRSHDYKHRNSPSRLRTQSPEVPRSKSPMRHTVETSTSKTVTTKHATVPGTDTTTHRPETDKPDKVPGYLRPTKTSQIREDKVIEESEVSSRRGSGKFGVELRRTSVDRATPTGERRRSVEHPCIEDIFDLEFLEQMLEKVTGYEQRRRIRAQIRVARKGDETNTFIKTTKTTLSVPRSKASESPKSPERSKTPSKTSSPDRKSTPSKAVSQPREVLVNNAQNKEIVEKPRHQRPESPEKLLTKSTPKSSTLQSTIEKKARPQSPAKTVAKPKSNRFNEYASAYMKKVGLNETSKLKITETKKSDVHKTSKQIEEHSTVEQYSTSKHTTERASSRDVIETVELNGKRSLSPEKKQTPERKVSPERQERSPSPELLRRKPDINQTETTIKTVYDIDKNIQPKIIQEEKPAWVRNRNLKKITSETRTISSKKIEPEKPKYRAGSPSKVISKPLDAITSSYGPGPLDSDGKPLFGIRALRNGASNYQVKGTVIRQEFHSRNGGEPEGTVSVTAYSTEPEELEKLLESQGAPPSRIHGLAAITTTRKFGGDTGTTIHQVHGKDERAVLDQFTHSDRRVSDFSDLSEAQGDSFDRVSETRRTTVEELDAHEDIGDTVYRKEIVRKGPRTEGKLHELRDKMDTMGDRKTVRQSSVKSLTEKFIKSASESSKTDRGTYPKAGLILRTATMKDSVSSDSSAHAGLMRTDSEHSIGSLDDTVVTTTSERVGDGIRTTTTTSTRHHERSFLDDSTKVTGVQDILTRMKNADIVIQEGDTNEDTEARALLNKFLGATVLMAGMQGYVTEKPSGKLIVNQETVRSSGGKVSSSQTVEEIDLDQCWDERVLKKLLEECSDYEQRRQLRARIRTLMAEQEACASAVTEALAAAGEPENAESTETREEAELTVTSSVRRDSSEKILSSSTTTKTSKVIENVTRTGPKPVSPFAKFRQLEKQNSTTSPKM